MRNATPIIPPGPQSRMPTGVMLRFRHDRLGFLAHTARRYGDIAHFRIMGRPVYLLSHPDLIQSLLEMEPAKLVKGRGLDRARRTLGQGLLTSEGEFHQRQRRLVLPAFHRERMASYGKVMVDHASALQARWLSGETRDIAADMMHLTRSIVAKTLFDYDVASLSGSIDAAMATLIGSFGSIALFLPDWVVDRGLWPSARRLDEASGVLDDLIYGMIRERRADGRDHGDLLSMLLAAEDVDGDGAGMTDRQVRDEAMTLFLAGHETTANALAWTWFLISEHPEVEARLHDELDRVLGGRNPDAADLPDLRYTRRVLAESMRLYPPAWVVGRRAIADLGIGGYGIPRGAGLLASQWVVHRDPRFYPDPLRFDPDRWLPEAQASRPKFAYFPFGGGPRRCVGEAFAWMEGVLILATIARRWQVRLVAGHPVVPEPLITLRPRHGVRVSLELRSTARTTRPVRAVAAPTPALP